MTRFSRPQPPRAFNASSSIRSMVLAKWHFTAMRFCPTRVFWQAIWLPTPCTFSLRIDHLPPRSRCVICTISPQGLVRENPWSGGCCWIAAKFSIAPAKAASRRQLQIAQARLKQSERILNLIRSNSSPNQFSETLASTLDQTAKEDQFRLSWSILQATHSADAIVVDVAFQEAALDQLASRFPATSAGRWAQLRRESIRHSLEWKRLRSTLAARTFQTVIARPAEIVPVSPFQTPQTGIRAGIGHFAPRRPHAGDT